ncbi:MAG TPA: hypothetical protein VK582_25535 [Pyrinomonadaceae bacterium]|nr:hypothetical protein [Pyrinomonadaceae bacterium]
MKILRKLGATVVLTSVLAVSAVAGEIPTPPCANPAPGQIETPPCSAAPGDSETPTLTSTSGDMGTPTVANDETLFSKIAADLLLNLLPLF